MLYNIAKGIVWVFFHIFYRIKIKGHENIPNNSGALICPNHFHLFDPLLVAICIKQPIRFMAKYELFQHRVLGFILKKIYVYPVKRGEADLSAIKNTFRILKDKQLVGIFPEGTRIKGGELGKANAGVAVFSIKTGSPAIPILISGNYIPFTKMTITIGKPVDLVQYKKEKMSNDDYLEISQIIMQKINELKKEAN
ncbi:MAG: 1-acyl-sn-glycerol-3-phosphate acyltransferase [Clostridiales bacterium]|nr:1-acyl-sn-glycerol-3-phosphate acyltransferase [Clostridiales bacterium]